MYKLSNITITTKTVKQAKRLYIKLFMMPKPTLISVKTYNGIIVEMSGFFSSNNKAGAVKAAEQFALKIKELKNTGIRRMIIDTKKVCKHKLVIFDKAKKEG